MPDLLGRLGVEFPVVQAGMGGGLANHELAAAVSDSGGLGTIGTLPGPLLREELAAARQLTARPVSVNLIVIYAGRDEWEAAADADVLVTHWESRPRRRTGNVWIHTVGSADEARASVVAGADGVIVQGVESGGHVCGDVPALELLERVLAAVPSGYPVLLAGGIAERGDVGTALDAGAEAAVCGTRFLASEESGAHPGYKERLVRGGDTILTELFGMTWARAPHRVLHNEATRRWLKRDPRGPAAVRLLHWALSPAARRAPESVQERLAQRISSGPLDLTPPAPTAGMPGEALETQPLYAGETVARINDVRPAAELLRGMVP
jgi:NAD(P)H-dependent flavin oxidoreductase YrpB (nitropropane dioxygenase family)